MKIKTLSWSLVLGLARYPIWLFAAVLSTILGYLFTTKVGGALLLVISGWLVTNITGSTPTQHIWEYIYNNPAEAPAILIELYLG